MLQVGAILHGTWRVDGYLSSGGFGNTYKATHIGFGTVRAIKEFFMKGITQRDESNSTVSVSLPQNKAQFDAQKDKFRREALRLYNMHNDHIVRVYDLFDENGTTYYVMDFIDGESLDERIKRQEAPVSEEQAEKYMLQVLDALEEVHRQKYWHLDIKPANIMVNSQDKAILIDFGASKQMDADGGAKDSSALCYTQGYAPLEQTSQDMKRFGPWTDLYALGATMYKIQTGDNPPASTDIIEEGEGAFNFPDSMSRKMRNAIMWMMKNKRTDRPQSVQQFLTRYQEEELETIVAPKKEKEPDQPVHGETTLLTPGEAAAQAAPKQDASKQETPKQEAPKQEAKQQKAEPAKPADAPKPAPEQEKKGRASFEQKKGIVSENEGHRKEEPQKETPKPEKKPAAPIQQKQDKPAEKKPQQPKPAATEKHAAEEKPAASRKWLWIGLGTALLLALLLIFLLTGKETGPKSAPEAPQTENTAAEPATPETKQVENEKFHNEALGDYTYTGEVMRKDDGTYLPNGNGKAQLFGNGADAYATYEGPFVQGKFHGDGAHFVYSDNGDTFDGSFKENFWDKGRYTIQETGAYFEGTFKDGAEYDGVWFDKNGKQTGKVVQGKAQ